MCKIVYTSNVGYTDLNDFEIPRRMVDELGLNNSCRDGFLQFSVGGDVQLDAGKQVRNEAEE